MNDLSSIELTRLTRVAVKLANIPYTWRDEAMGVASEAVWRASLTFDPVRFPDSELGLHCIVRAKLHVIDWYRTWVKYRRPGRIDDFQWQVESIDKLRRMPSGDPEPMQIAAPETIDEVDDALAFDRMRAGILARLTPQETEVFLLRVDEGLTLREIGLRLGFSESRACQIMTRIRPRARRVVNR